MNEISGFSGFSGSHKKSVNLHGKGLYLTKSLRMVKLCRYITTQVPFGHNRVPVIAHDGIKICLTIRFELNLAVFYKNGAG